MKTVISHANDRAKNYLKSLPWIMPIALVICSIGLLIWLPWLAQKNESSEKQEQLIADTLWVEQSISFQIQRDQENMLLIAKELDQGKLTKKELETRLQSLASHNREVIEIAFWDEENQIIAGNGQGSSPQNYLQTQTSKLIDESLFLSTRQAQCKPALDSSQLLHCLYPRYHENRYLGSASVIYQLQNLLNETIPWWFAQENEISLLDQQERVLVKRTAGALGKNIYTHNRSIDFPGYSLRLHINSTKSEPKLLSNFLVLSILILSLGLIWSLIALWRDIQRRLKTEATLRSEVSFRAAMENSLITGLRARDMEGRLTYVNPAFCKMIGFPADELIGKLPPMPYWAAEAREEYEHRFAQIISGTVQPEGFETIYQHANGERFPVLIYESPLVDNQGQQTGWMSSILDISELKRAQELSRQHEEKLHANAKLATMGEIASMMAHELNQPLAAISSYTTGALNVLKSPHIDQELLIKALENAYQQAQRAGLVIRSVHEFVKKRESHRSPISVESLVQSVTPLIELQAQNSHVMVSYNIQKSLPPIYADKILLEQVLLNLTRNGIESMQTSSQNRMELCIRAFTSEFENNVVIFQVIDHGHGIEKETAELLFSPFFSTKTAGMGMGLKICRTAIEFHGGSLNYHPNPMGGTIFEFSIPCFTMNQESAVKP